MLHRSHSTGRVLSFGEELFSTQLSHFLVSYHQFLLILFISLWQELTVSVNSKVILAENTYLFFLLLQVNSHPIGLLENILTLSSEGLQLMASVGPFVSNKHFEVGRIGLVPDLLLGKGHSGVEIKSRTEQKLEDVPIISLVSEVPIHRIALLRVHRQFHFLLLLVEDFGRDRSQFIFDEADLLLLLWLQNHPSDFIIGKQGGECNVDNYKIMEEDMPKPKGKEPKKSDHRDQVQKQKLASELYNEAREFFGKYTKEKNKADAQYAIQKFSEAITCLQSAPNSDKGSTHARYHSERGEAFMAIGHYQKAMYDFGTAIRFDGNNAQYYANRGNCMMMLNQINDALAEFHKAISMKPQDGFYYFNRGLVHARLMNFTSAIQDFTEGLKYIKSGDTNFKALFHRGNCYRQIKQYGKSISDLSRACQAVKEDAPAQNNLGLSYFENQQYDQALERFKRAIQLDPSKATYYNNKALALYHNQMYEESLQEYNKALTLDPQDARTLFNRGNTYLALRRIEQAHQDFDAAIRLMPTNAKFYHSKGLAYQDTEEYELAINMFQKALQVSNDHIPSLYHLGLMQHRSGKLTQALESLTKVLSAIGEDRLVYESRGLVYQDMKNYRKAIGDFDKAAEIEPTYAQTYFLRGISKVELGKFGEGTYQDAIQDFLYAEELGSKNAGIFKGIGQAYRLMKDYEKALYYLNEALKREPLNEEFLMERSNIYVDICQFPKAIEDLTNALSRKSTDPKILYKRGLAFYRNKQFKKAIKDLYFSLENNPFQTYEADIYYHLGISYANLDMNEKAISPLSKAIELAYNQPPYIHERAKSYLLTDQYQKSLEDYTQVIELQPKNSHAYFGRAFALKALKNYEDAAEDLQKAKELDPFNPKLIVNPKKIYEIKYIKLCDPGEEQK